MREVCDGRLCECSRLALAHRATAFGFGFRCSWRILHSAPSASSIARTTVDGFLRARTRYDRTAKEWTQQPLTVRPALRARRNACISKTPAVEVTSRFAHDSAREARQESVRRESDVVIHSKQNTRVKYARTLLRSRSRDREGRLLLEGHRLVLDALDSGCKLETIFFTEEALFRGSYGPQLRRALFPESSDVDVDNPSTRNRHSYLRSCALVQVTPEVIEHISDTVTPQGVVAVIERPVHARIAESASFVLLCDGVKDPGNVGTLLRAAAGAGADAVVFAPGCADPWGLKALRAGMGAQLRISIHDDLDWDGIADLLVRDLHLRVCVASGAEDTRTTGGIADASRLGKPLSFEDYPWRERFALIIGSEADGPCKRAFDIATDIVTIPMANNVESLNAATAGAVLLFQASAARRRKQ